MGLRTKRDFQELLLGILGPVKARYSEGRARVSLGATGAVYGETAAELEAFSRPLWGLAPFFCGGGEDAEFEALCLEGIKNGSDPNHPEYWGGFVDCDQRFVEMAALAHGILIARGKLFDPLSAAQKDALAAWLSCINKYRLPENNWQLFAVVVNVALKKLTGRCDEAAMERQLALMESYYLGEGWYADGPSGHTDYYVSFAIHYNCLLYAAAMEDEDSARCAEYKRRADLFARDFAYWFSEKGDGIPYGRSLTYRFAQVAFFSACVYAGVEPFGMAVMKGIIARNLEWWTAQPIFDSGGLLTIGYRYPNLAMAECYNAPGSPYWALETFLCLALPDGHPFWAAEAAPLPEMEPLKTLEKAEMIVARRGGEVTAHPSGKTAATPAGERLPSDCLMGHLPEKYAKFAYSTRHGFCVQRGSDCLENMAPDSTLCFEVGGLYFARANVASCKIEGGAVTTEWRPHPAIRVATKIVPTETGHVRTHTIESDVECVAYDCGFAVSKSGEDYRAAVGSSFAEIAGKEGFCRVSGSCGGDGGGTAVRHVIIEAAPNTNIVHPRAAIPAARYHIKEGKSELTTVVEDG